MRRLEGVGREERSEEGRRLEMRRGEERKGGEGRGEPLSLCICLQPTEPSDAHLMLNFGKDKTTKHSSNGCLLQL